jgi:hypothetical protein
MNGEALLFGEKTSQKQLTSTTFIILTTLSYYATNG